MLSNYYYRTPRFFDENFSEKPPSSVVTNGREFAYGGERKLTEETYKFLCEADWGAISKRLLAVAIRRAAMYGWLYSHRQDLHGPEGKTIYDIVQTVIEKTLRGDRKWDPAKGALEPWLADQVRSEIDHSFHSSATMHETRFTAQEGDSYSVRGNTTPSSEDDCPSPDRSAEAAILQKEQINSDKAQVDQILEKISGEKELEDVALAIMDGCEPKPRFIAEYLQITVDEVHRRLKRIKYRAGEN